MALGILTGGSDCQGLNASICAIIRSVNVGKGRDVIGFLQGWRWLIDNEFIPLIMEDVSGILPIGGSILGTSRLNPLREENGLEIIEENLKKNKIEVLVALGGYETQGIALELHIQRGGTPSAFDRILATHLGNYAVELIEKRNTD